MQRAFVGKSMKNAHISPRKLGFYVYHSIDEVPGLMALRLWDFVSTMRKQHVWTMGDTFMRESKCDIYNAK